MSRDLKPINLRLPSDLKSWVDEKAKSEHRSINGQLTVFVEQAKKAEDQAKEVSSHG